MDKSRIDNIRILTESALKHCDNNILWRDALAWYVKEDLSKVLKICKELLQQQDSADTYLCKRCGHTHKKGKLCSGRTDID